MAKTSSARQEVERALDRTTASIADSISRIKSDLSLPSVPVKSAIKNHPFEILGGALAVGLAAGWLAVGRKKHNSTELPSTDRKRGDFDPEEFLHLVRAAKASGLTEEAAVAQALSVTSSTLRRQSSARRDLTQRLGDHVLDMADAIIKTALRVATREAAAWVADAVTRDKKNPSQ